MASEDQFRVLLKACNRLINQITDSFGTKIANLVFFGVYLFPFIRGGTCIEDGKQEIFRFLH